APPRVSLPPTATDTRGDTADETRGGGGRRRRRTRRTGGRVGDGCPRREGRTPRDHARGAGALGQAGGRAGLPRLGHARPARRLDAADAACERDRVAALAADAAVELVHVSPRARALLAARAEPLLLRDPPVALHPRRRRGRRRGRVPVVSETRSRVS